MIITQTKKRDKLLKNIKVGLRLAYFVLCISIVLWGIISYLQIITQNLDMTNPTVLSKWNLFELAFSKYYK